MTMVKFIPVLSSVKGNKKSIIYDATMFVEGCLRLLQTSMIVLFYVMLLTTGYVPAVVCCSPVTCISYLHPGLPQS